LIKRALEMEEIKWRIGVISKIIREETCRAASVRQRPDLRNYNRDLA